jgi:hypothetical protein
MAQTDVDELMNLKLLNKLSLGHSWEKVKILTTLLHITVTVIIGLIEIFLTLS